MSRIEKRINRELREQLTNINTQNIGKGELKGMLRRLADNFHSYDKLTGMKFYGNPSRLRNDDACSMPLPRMAQYQKNKRNTARRLDRLHRQRVFWIGL